MLMVQSITLTLCRETILSESTSLWPGFNPPAINCAQPHCVCVCLTPQNISTKSAPIINSKTACDVSLQY